MAYSEKKSKVYYVIGQILFWYIIVAALSGVLLRPSLASLWGCFFEISLVSWIAFILFIRSAKNLPEDKLKQRNLRRQFLPRAVFNVYTIAVVLFIILTLLLILIPIIVKMTQ